MRFRAFVISSMLLFIMTVMAVWVDFDREWKKYQSDFNKIEFDKTKSELDDLKKSMDADSDYKKLEASYKSSEDQVNSPEAIAKQKESDQKMAKLKFDVYKAERDAKFTKSTIGSLDYQISRNVSNNDSTTALNDQKVLLQAKLDEQNKAVDVVRASFDKAQQEAKDAVKQYTELKSKFEDKNAKVELLNKKLDVIAKRPIDIQQIIIPELNNTVDRCMTCHMAANTDGFEDKKYPKVFQTHPNRELFLVKHNVKDFGCVVCHQGQGLSTKSKSAHGWVEFWEKPMFKGKQVEASCIKCHKTTDNIPADYFNKGKELVTASNCLACHKIEGQPAAAKNGPPLLQASSKLNATWMVNWVENPRHYLPRSKMPTFPLGKEEATAITAYVLSSSDPNYGIKKGVVPDPSLVGNGQRVFKAKGCNSCHAIKGVGANVGPDLGRVGSKANPTWMYNWIKNPQSYHPGTVMPNLGLTDEETLSVVSWLQTFKWDNMPQSQVDIHNVELATKGKAIMKNYNCASCHNVVGLEGAQNCPELTGEAEKDIHKFDFGYAHRDPLRGVYHTRESYIYNKIRNPRVYNDFVKSKMPRFWFTDEQTSQAYTYIMGMTGKYDDLPYKYIYKPKTVEESNEEVKKK